MKKLSIFTFAVIVSAQVMGQSYFTSAGLRFGTDWGLTVQQRVARNYTVEGILQSSFQRNEVLMTGLLERHYPIAHRGLNIYFGGGLHKGWLNEPANRENSRRSGDPFGVTLVGGAELTLGRVNISYDFKPAVNLQGGEHTFYTQSGLSVRYVLISNKDLKKHQKAKRKKQRQEQRRQNGGGIRIGDDWKIWKKD